MKSLLLTLALAVLSTAAFAQVQESDVLVTPEGTVYTVTTEYPAQSSSNDPTGVISLATQTGTQTTHQNVPESLTPGFNKNGTLAYDSDSKTLFVLWIHQPNQMSSELMIASYRNGRWQPAIAIDHQAYTDRTNMRLGITRRVSQLQKDGTYADVPALILHALWWDYSLKGQEARYALLPIENGALSESSVEIHSLDEFIPAEDEVVRVVDTKFNAVILHQPAIVSSPMQSTLDVVFGDVKSNSLHSVTLRPIADVRIHIPVGVIGGGGSGGGGRIKPLTVAAPVNFSDDWKGQISVIQRGDRIAMANASANSLNYITYANGAWSTVKSIAIDNHFPAEAAISALDKMLSTQ